MAQPAAPATAEAPAAQPAAPSSATQPAAPSPSAPTPAPAAPGPDSAAQTAAPQTTAAPAAASATTQPAPAQGATAGAVTVAYVKHTKPPLLSDTTPGKAGMAMVGAIVALSTGKEIVETNDIQDPSGAMAHDIAAAYAAAHGAQVQDAPISSDRAMTRAKPEELAQQAAGARYVVDVDPPGLNLIYFGLDWGKYDLMFMDYVRIIDTSSNTVVAHAKCFLRTEKTPDSPSHDALLANRAEKLKALLAKKSQTCVERMKADLKL